MTIATTFEAFVRLVGELDQGAAREGLDEETLALFELLKKDKLERKDIECIKKVAFELCDIVQRRSTTGALGGT